MTCTSWWAHCHAPDSSGCVPLHGLALPCCCLPLPTRQLVVHPAATPHVCRRCASGRQQPKHWAHVLLCACACCCRAGPHPAAVCGGAALARKRRCSPPGRAAGAAGQVRTQQGGCTLLPCCWSDDGDAHRLCALTARKQHASAASLLGSCQLLLFSTLQRLESTLGMIVTVCLHWQAPHGALTHAALGPHAFHALRQAGRRCVCAERAGCRAGVPALVTTAASKQGRGPPAAAVGGERGARAMKFSSMPLVRVRQQHQHQHHQQRLHPRGLCTPAGDGVPSASQQRHL